MKFSGLWLVVLVLGLAAIPRSGWAQSAAATGCPGDCNGDGTVTIDELVTGIDIALGIAPLDQCPAIDCNGNGEVAVDCLVKAVAAAESGCPPPQLGRFEHVVVIVQENRTPDNLFQGLCAAPFGSASSCSTQPNSSQYDIQTGNWLDKTSPGGTTQPSAVPLANTYDLSHAHSAFVAMCDVPALAPMPPVCAMDGAANVQCSSVVFQCQEKPQFKYVDNSSGILNPYLTLATRYGWANYMFQTNQGPSFPAHQFLFGGTSAPSAADDAAGVFASENMTPVSEVGCTAELTTTVPLIMPGGDESQSTYPCFEHSTLPDVLPSIAWKYYAPSAGSIWTAPNAIDHICQSSGPGGHCLGQEWMESLDLNPADVLNDIANCNLRSVSWVIPTGQNSDHAKVNDGGGPAWVAAIVNAIGHSTACDNNTGYWKNTAILITWDDWGGWYDHEPPPILQGVQGDYQYGFRVPLIVVSAYTPAGYINNAPHDFGSILRFIEHNYGVREGALNFADARAATDLTKFFDLTQPPREFEDTTAPVDAAFFLGDTRPPTDPDDE
jgi:phospholipase C